MNVSNPQNVIRLGGYNTPGNSYGIAVQNNIVYISDGNAGLQIINGSDLQNPTYLGNYVTPGTAQDLVVENNIVYLAVNVFGLQLINVSRVNNPILIQTFNTPGIAWNIAVQKGIAYVADDAFGIEIINITNPHDLRLIGNYQTLGNAEGIAVESGFVYIATDTSGLEILNLQHTRIFGTLPINLTDNYNFTAYATNINGEWISANFNLKIGAPPTTPISSVITMSVITPSITISSMAIPTPSSAGINLPAVIQNNTLSLSMGNTMTLLSPNLNATDDFTPASNLLFIVSQVSNGYFQTTNNPAVSIYSFTQQQIQNGEIQFVHDGSNNPPSYQLYVNDGSLNSLPQWAAITFNGNAVPVLMNNKITITIGQTVLLNSTNLHATDTDNSNIDTLIFTVSDTQRGSFENSDSPGTSITRFTQADVNAGKISFTHDGSTNYPSYFVSVSDGTFDTPPSLVQINFNNNAIPIVLSNQITITPGQSTTIGIANIGGLDLDSNSNNLIFIITDITGGQFELINNPGVDIAQFTQQDIINGNVQFTADAIDCQNPTSPSYNLQASDGSYSTVFNIANVEYNTHTTTNGCVTITTEKDNTNLYIGVGVGVGAAALVAGALGIFAMKRRHQRERDAERVEQMVEMTQDAAKYKSQVLIKR